MVSKYFEDIKIKFVEDGDKYAKIISEPFERGYGVTMGSALRRVLMTSVPGAAIVSVKIDGVQHEFSSIDGILEDVSDIILNLKEVIFKTINDGPEEISISLEGPTEFKASHIAELSNDEATSESALLDVLDKLKINENYVPDITVFLQCTSPCTTSNFSNKVLCIIDNHYDPLHSN